MERGRTPLEWEDRGGICYHPAYFELVAHTGLTGLSKFAIPVKKVAKSRKALYRS
jgi:hypothetical protein